MPLLLVPYNDAMRLGMGFNSYTQTMCIDSAVDATDETMITSETLPPKITSSTRLFERVSEVVDTMDISRAATITTGEMEVHGHKKALNDAEIDDADINLMVSVRVMSEITSLKGSARFLPIDGMEAGSARFNETFGDSYISGFITGGLLTSIISFVSSDPDRKDKLIEAVKKGLNEPTMDLENICKEFAIASVTQGAEVEDINSASDVASILRIAGEFPTLVAQDPQRTWAILTKYKANRSFNEWSSYQILKPLDYDSVAPYTSKLFDTYIQYSHLSKKVQDILSQRDQYSQVDKPRAIPVELNTLLATRSALNREMNKIVAVVNTLTRHPELLPQIDLLNANLKDDLVQDIVNEALSDSSRPTSQQESTVQEDPFLSSVGDYASSELSSGVDGLHTPFSSGLDTSSISTGTLVFRDETEPSTDLVLVPPEVWADLLPVKNDPSTSLVNQQAKAAPAPTVKYKELKILAAVCGTYDVTAKLQKLVRPGKTGDRLVIRLNDLKTLGKSDCHTDLAPWNTTNLSFVYKYTYTPIRICSFGPDAQSTETLDITHEYEAQNAKFVRTSHKTCHMLGMTYGGKIYTSSDDLQPFVVDADHITPGGWPYVHFDPKTIKDEHLGNDGMIRVVFYTYGILNGVQSAVSVGTTGCLLVDQRQLATGVETAKWATSSFSKNDSKEVKPNQVTLVRGINWTRKSDSDHNPVQPLTYLPDHSCSFLPGNLEVSPSETAFLQLENGVKFTFRTNGRLEVLDEQGEIFWSSEEAPEGQSPGSLQFCCDGILRLWNTDGKVYWTPLMKKVSGSERKLAFSCEFPYLWIFDSEGAVWRAHGPRSV
ncbi:hypothetical protein FPANT_7097 [Fusarium pseudoanthophilum]|uniref:Bulb-type lectin domain-containing protein n=1 Tax=Fusarium pseudoanthophilum TaxID=48495 RepID=A0A8H5LA28_9HYPO|nr:hypothetical protein FPANT_7097 [Fusarium pseudoanthophilum]